MLLGSAVVQRRVLASLWAGNTAHGVPPCRSQETAPPCGLELGSRDVGQSSGHGYRTRQPAGRISISYHAAGHATHCDARLRARFVSGPRHRRLLQRLDLVGGFSDPSLAKKIHLLQDAMSDVPTFDQVGRKFIDDMHRLGMNMTTTKDFLASI